MFTKVSEYGTIIYESKTKMRIIIMKKRLVALLFTILILATLSACSNQCRNGHTEEIIPGKEATCTETGLTEGKKCSVCGEVITAQTEIPAKGHNEIIIPSKEATCTETGLTEGKKCSVCGEVITAQTEIPAKGHNEIIIPGKEATCTETGLTEGKMCSVCGEVITAQTEIPSKGHNEIIISSVEPTCIFCGNTEGRICTVCGKITVKPEEIPATGHTEEIIPAKEPTEIEAGLTEGKRCSVCGEILVQQTKTYLNNLPVIPYGSEGLEYMIIQNGQGVRVESVGTCTDTDIVIPDKVTIQLETYPVTQIHVNAFLGCENITSISLPDTVTYISGSAFEGCTGLTSFTFPDHIKNVGYNIFKNCTGLQEVFLPKDLVSIETQDYDWSTFYGCENLSDIYFPRTTEEWIVEMNGDYCIPYIESNYVFTTRDYTVHCSNGDLSYKGKIIRYIQ